MNQPRQRTVGRLSLELEQVELELERVDSRLQKGTATGQDRLAILRRQAALGDLRDELTRRRRIEAG